MEETGGTPCLVFPSASPRRSPRSRSSPGPGACAGPGVDAPESDYVTDGKLTIGTGEPAFFPYVIDDDPTTGKGFEAAVAYAVAEELGFAKEDVVWVRTGFDEVIAPGPKNFDFNLQQFSITDERKQQVDFSSPYYEATQAVITVEGSAAADATSIADLKDLLIGAATGTTSFQAIEETIQPTKGAQVFNTNDDAKLALEQGQVDAIVVDLPTAFYITGVELEGGKIVGQLPATAGHQRRVGPAAREGQPAHLGRDRGRRLAARQRHARRARRRRGSERMPGLRS